MNKEKRNQQIGKKRMEKTEEAVWTTVVHGAKTFNSNMHKIM
jgi:hypothetical protein